MKVRIVMNNGDVVMYGLLPVMKLSPDMARTVAEGLLMGADAVEDDPDLDTADESDVLLQRCLAIRGFVSTAYTIEAEASS